MTTFPDERLNAHEMTPESCVDAVELRRLAEGRLEPEERDAILQWAEDHPAVWREIALACLDEQTLQQAVPSLDRTSPVRRHRRSRALRTAVGVTAACVCLAVAGLAGTSYGQQKAIAEAPPPPAAPDPVLVWTTARPVPQRSAIEDALLHAARPVFDAQTRETLLRAGVIAEERPSIRFVSGPDGQAIPVPERELIFRPASGLQTEVSKPDSYPEGRQ